MAIISKFPTDSAVKLSFSKIADNTISALQIVRLTSDTNIDLADKSVLGTALAAGIAINGGTVGSTIVVVAAGIVEDASFTYTLNDILFLNTSGAITTVAPTTGFSTVIGKSLGTGAIYINIEQPIAL